MSDPTLTPQARHQGWRQRRLAELTAADGWPGLIGLFWLEPGANVVGWGEDCTVRLPAEVAEAANLGVIEWSGETVESVRWRPREGDPQTLLIDAKGAPTTVAWGDYRFTVIARDGRLAVRLRDLAWQARRPFPGIDCFDYDPAWRIEARWETLAESLTMEVPTVTGELKSVQVGYRAVFEIQGQTLALLPMEVTGESVFFVFRDGSSGRLTYGAGRFLRTAAPEHGRLVLDFNRAYNPPCAFTPFATCPLPPPENWLPLAILAGEKKFQGDH
ncbi:hypothetical protein AZSI13_20140 [Azospira sp. I13]|uniref:DUF1684 domain-containing protein n=1 Tax=Azospira sp. I13 TaxID=1765050 RepID=UPI000D4CA0F1|nr:DUF1684 domain-containing protein [Azospira sp. I13]GBG02687.1 hypothetical protein AZSI13_20140 [Azospira sp. I13]